MGNKKKQDVYPVALTIAGSDSGGGAGIQADLRTFSAFGVYGASVVTAVTAQNPQQVLRIDGLPPESISAQLEAVLSLSITTIKTGMLFNKEIIQVVVETLKDRSLNLVVDPVMISTSGVKLLADDAIDSLKNTLLPLATWITPNVPEAEELTGITIKSLADMVTAGKSISEKWDCNCVLKGGHLDSHSELITDIIIYNGTPYELSSPKLHDCTATHGTGCTFSAAMTAAYAIDLEWDEMLMAAKSFVFGSLNEAVPIGEDIHAMYPPTHNYNDNISLDVYE